MSVNSRLPIVDVNITLTQPFSWLSTRKSRISFALTTKLINRGDEASRGVRRSGPEYVQIVLEHFEDVEKKEAEAGKARRH